MRRSKQALGQAEIERILQCNTSGVLSLVDSNGYPYGVPLSYVYANGKIYFHSAKSGHKIDAVNHCNKATFCLVDKDDVKPEKYTTFYRSVIAFGKVEIVNDDEEALRAMQALGNKYYPHHDTELQQEIDKNANRFVIIKFEIEHITGKQAIELLQ